MPAEKTAPVAATPEVDVADAVKQLEVKLDEMTKDRNAFRAEFNDLTKKHESVKAELTALKKAKAPPAPTLPKDLVVIGGKTRNIVEAIDGDNALHKLRQNVGDCRTQSLWVEVK